MNIEKGRGTEGGIRMIKGVEWLLVIIGILGFAIVYFYGMFGLKMLARWIVNKRMDAKGSKPKVSELEERLLKVGKECWRECRALGIAGCSTDMYEVGLQAELDEQMFRLIVAHSQGGRVTYEFYADVVEEEVKKAELSGNLTEAQVVEYIAENLCDLQARLRLSMKTEVEKKEKPPKPKKPKKGMEDIKW